MTIQGVTKNVIEQLEIPVLSLTEHEQVVKEVEREYHTLQGCYKLKTKMEAKIKELVNSLWGVGIGRSIIHSSQGSQDSISKTP